MNRNAKANYKNGFTAINNGATFAAKPFDKFQGRDCPTAFAATNPARRKKGPRKACSKGT